MKKNIHHFTFILFFIIVIVGVLYLLGRYQQDVSITINKHTDSAPTESLILGEWNEQTLTNLIQEAKGVVTAEDQVNIISEKFLDTPYQGNTLTGNMETPEVFTVNLAGLDCFTYIDYVEALRSSDSFPGFKDKLKDIRYRDGAVGFTSRNHFFSDWPANNNNHVRDVTREVGGAQAVDVVKHLNQKEDGTVFLPGIPVITRTITYIPVEHLGSAAVINNLRTGDYVGSYTNIEGLDVTHTGIIIKKGDTIYLRHASIRESVGKKVVDEDLLEYMKKRTGLVVYRPADISNE